LKRDSQWITLSLLLIALGGLIFAYKVVRLGYPPYPDMESAAWTIQAKLELTPERGAVRASLTLPSRPTGYELAQENFVSRGFGLTVKDDEYEREADWAIRRLREPKSLYYRALVIPATSTRNFAPRPDYPAPPELEEPFATAARDLVNEVRAESADTESFAAAMLNRLTGSRPDENMDLFLADVETFRDRVNLAQTLLAGARIPTLQLHGIRLDKDAQRAHLETLLAVYNGDEWLVFDPVSAEEGLPADFFIWWTGKGDLADVKGAQISDLQISTRHRVKSSLELAQQRSELQKSRVSLISTLQLPIQTQAVYEILLLIPLGILVIVLLRNFVGLSSFGTFAPVLIALAFRETELLKGIGLFVLIVSLGLFFRFYLERLRLLLVPRLAAVVTIVVLLMTAISIVSDQFGMETGLSVSLFPMIIVSMVIERMSVIWEERGAMASIKEGIGSLFMAALAYLVMSVDVFAYWVTVYPELNLMLLGVIIALGRYTGFRLTELRRFKPLVVQQKVPE
jgi:hypothetical protein